MSQYLLWISHDICSNQWLENVAWSFNFHARIGLQNGTQTTIWVLEVNVQFCLNYFIQWTKLHGMFYLTILQKDGYFRNHLEKCDVALHNNKWNGYKSLFWTQGKIEISMYEFYYHIYSYLTMFCYILAGCVTQ